MFIYWGMVLSIAGMYTMYISEIGFNKKEIGIAVTIYYVSTLIGQIFLGYLVDKFKCMKRIALSSISIGFIVAAGLHFAVSSLQVYVLIAMWGFFVVGTAPLLDAWCIGILKTCGEQNNFGKIRGFGSVGYGLSGALLGIFLEKFGWNIYYPYIAATVMFTLIIICMNEDKSPGTIAKRSQQVSLKEALSHIFRIKPIIMMIIIVFMYNFACRGIYSYLGILVKDFGGGVLSLGFTYFFDATPEVVTFFLTARLLKRFRNKSLIFAAFLLQIIRLTVIYIYSNAIVVIFMGILSGFAFGLMHASYRTYIYELAPDKYKASCLSLSDTIVGLSGIISAPVFGFMFARFGTDATIAFGLIINIMMAFILLMDMLHFMRHKTGKSQTGETL